MPLLVIDGNSIVNRAFYGVKALTTRDGRYTNAIVGFLNILARLREMTGADRIAVAFDVHAPTFRHQMYADYKAGRRAMPEELCQQMEPLKAILRAMGLTLTEKAGFEADDILGTLSRVAAEQEIPCFLATGDRDSFQLVGDGVTVLLAGSHLGKSETQVIDTAAIREKYDLSPEQMIDLKGLQGDASDHIPGVPGVGEKTALDLMHRFGSLNALYASLETAPDIREGLKNRLIAGRESAELSRKLGTICRTADIDTDLSHYAVGAMDREKLSALLQDLELYKWMEKWDLTAAEETPTATEEEPLTALPVAGNEAAAQITAAARKTGKLDLIAVIEDGELGSLALAADGILARVDRLAPEFEALEDLLTDPDVKKRTHDGKPLFAYLLRQGKKPAGFVMDTALAAYLLNPLDSGYDLTRLMRDYGISVPEGEPLQGYSRLADRLTAEVEKQEMTVLLNEVELPLAEVLAAMENDGCAVDRDGIVDLGRELSGRIVSLQNAIYEQVGYEFNLNSPKQLSKALFDDMGLPVK